MTIGPLVTGSEITAYFLSIVTMANCIKTLGAYYGRPTWFEKVFPSSRPCSVRTVAPPKLTLGTDLKTKFVTIRYCIDSSCACHNSRVISGYVYVVCGTREKNGHLHKV
jgi:hypothetical protein